MPELEAARARAPVPGAAVGPADGRPLPVGPPARRPRRLPAARARSSTSSASSPGPSCGGSRRRSSPRTRRSTRRRRGGAAAPRGLPLALEAVGPGVRRPRRELAGSAQRGTRPWPGAAASCPCSVPKGIGKTRLVAELARRATTPAASCSTAGATTPTRRPGARRSALRSAGGASVGRPRRRDRRRPGRCVARHLPAWAGGRPGAARPRRPPPRRRRDPRVRGRPGRVVHRRPDPRRRRVPERRADAGRRGRRRGGGAPSWCSAASTTTPSASICRLYEPTGGPPTRCASSPTHRRRAPPRARAGERLGTGAGGPPGHGRGGPARRARGRLLASRGEVADGVEGIQRLLEQRRAQLAGARPAAGAAVAALAACPYKGLARFEAADAANFFGRERLVAELVARVAGAQLLAVVGPSGSGKSSLVRAGLLPALAAGVLAGSEPGARRCSARAPDPQPSSAAACAACRRGDAAGVSRRPVRGDLHARRRRRGAAPSSSTASSRCAAPATRRRARRPRRPSRRAAPPTPTWPPRSTGNDVLVGPMRDGELRRTSRAAGPARRARGRARARRGHRRRRRRSGRGPAAAVDGARRDVGAPRGPHPDPRRLPRRRRGQRRAGPAGRGRVRGPSPSGPAGRPPDPPAAVRRRRRRRLSTSAAACRWPTWSTRATPTGGPRSRRWPTGGCSAVDGDTVEVAHEALLREWPRLRTWLDEDVRAGGSTGASAMRPGRGTPAGRDPSELYRGARLDAAIEWADGHDRGAERDRAGVPRRQPGRRCPGAGRGRTAGRRPGPHQPPAPPGPGRRRRAARRVPRRRGGRRRPAGSGRRRPVCRRTPVDDGASGTRGRGRGDPGHQARPGGAPRPRRLRDRAAPRDLRGAVRHLHRRSAHLAHPPPRRREGEHRRAVARRRARSRWSTTTSG